MVRLTRIYTRGGDTGQTSLGDGSRVAKQSPRVEAFGTVDEANAAVGVARLHAAQSELAVNDPSRVKTPIIARGQVLKLAAEVGARIEHAFALTEKGRTRPMRPDSWGPNLLAEGAILMLTAASLAAGSALSPATRPKA